MTFWSGSVPRVPSVHSPPLDVAPKRLVLRCARAVMSNRLRTSRESSPGGNEDSHRTRGPADEGGRASRMVERDRALPLGTAFRSFRPRNHGTCVDCGGRCTGRSRSPTPGASHYWPPSRRAPRRCEPDVGAWFSSTKVLTSIPFRLECVANQRSVAGMTGDASHKRQPTLPRGTADRTDATSSPAMIEWFHALLGTDDQDARHHIDTDVAAPDNDSETMPELRRAARAPVRRPRDVPAL